MKLVSRHRLICGDCIEVMRSLPDSSVHAVVTDPPYGIGFMGKGWDGAVPGDAFAAEAFRVLKPGGHLIAFAATRTVHRLTVALEDAGFEVRDMIAWLQWQGFPKSLDVSKAIDKEAGAERTETIGPTYKVPNAKTVNPHFINAAGKRSDGDTEISYARTKPVTAEAIEWDGWGTALKPAHEPAVVVRKPIEGTVAQNVKAHGAGGLNIDACRMRYGDPAWPGPNDKWDMSTGEASPTKATWGGDLNARVSQPDELGRWPANIFHAPKPSVSERGEDNLHPTVKPVELMKWLVRLVTPKDGIVLEPFCGSGTTLLAGHIEDVRVIAIEQAPEYCDIIKSRMTQLDPEMEVTRRAETETAGET